MKLWSLAVLLMATGGCISNRQAGDLANAVVTKAILDSPMEIHGTTTLSNLDFHFPLYSLAGDQTLNLDVTYSGSFKINNSYSNLSAAIKSIPQGFAQAALYSANQAVLFMETGRCDHSVAITCADGESAIEKARANLANWRFDTNQVEFCKNTLAVRQGTNIIDFLPERKDLQRDWAPLDWNSWPVWYGQLDDRLHLGETLGLSK